MILNRSWLRGAFGSPSTPTQLCKAAIQREFPANIYFVSFSTAGGCFMMAL